MPGYASPDSVKRLTRGALVTAALGLQAAGGAKTRPLPYSQVRRIAVIRPDHLGDLLFATPALERIRDLFPAAHITGVVGPWGVQMWRGNPNLNALASVRFPGIVEGGAGLQPYRLLVRAAREMRASAFDLGIVLRADHWWGAALLWGAGVPRRWGYAVPGVPGRLTGSAPYAPGLHEVEQDLRLVEALGEEVAAEQVGQAHLSPPVRREIGEPRLRPPAPEEPRPGELQKWLDAPRRAIIHPGTAASNKLWTLDGWAQVAGALIERGWAVALTGAPSERPLAEAIVDRAAKGPLNLAGLTENVPQLVWILARAGMVLGVDSGPLHIASALDTPTLHLYGPSDERVWGPWGDPARHISLRAPGTVPTMRLETWSTALEGGPEMRAITPQMVLGEIARLEIVAT